MTQMEVHWVDQMAGARASEILFIVMKDAIKVRDQSTNTVEESYMKNTFSPEG